jgi:hypothetical protein
LFEFPAAGIILKKSVFAEFTRNFVELDPSEVIVFDEFDRSLVIGPFFLVIYTDNSQVFHGDQSLFPKLDQSFERSQGRIKNGQSHFFRKLFCSIEESFGRLVRGFASVKQEDESRE